MTQEALPRSRRPRFTVVKLIRVGIGIYLAWTVVKYGISYFRTNFRLKRAIAAADRLDPNWRLNDLWAKRSIPAASDNSIQVVDVALQGMTRPWPQASRATAGGPDECKDRSREGL